MEEHVQRLLVRAVAVRHAAAAQQPAGADADHDAGQPQGGAGIRVGQQHAGLPSQETDPVHRVHVDQGLLLPSLDKTLCGSTFSHVLFVV